jgi:hypothetical protein
MAQLIYRKVPYELAQRVKFAALAQGLSAKAWVLRVLEEALNVDERGRTARSSEANYEQRDPFRSEKKF